METPPGKLPTPASSRPTTSHYGINSLLSADYDQYDWLGYRNQPSTEQEQTQNRSGERTGTIPSRSPSHQDAQRASSSPTSDLYSGMQTPFSGSGFMPWRSDLPSTKANDSQSRDGVRTPPTSAGLSVMLTPLSLDNQDATAGSSRSMNGRSLLSTLSPQDDERVVSQSRYQLQRTTHMSFRRQPMSAEDTELKQRMRFSEHSLAPLNPFTAGPSLSEDDTDYLQTSSTYSRLLGERLTGVSLANEAGAPTRYLKVSNVSRDMSIWMARDAFKVSSDILDNENEGILAILLVAPRLSENDLLRTLSSYGDIQSFQKESDGWPLVTLVEYYDIRHAAFAKTSLQSLHTSNQVHCQVSYYRRERVGTYKGQHQQDDRMGQWSSSTIDRFTTAPESVSSNVCRHPEIITRGVPGNRVSADLTAKLDTSTLFLSSSLETSMISPPYTVKDKNIGNNTRDALNQLQETSFAESFTGLKLDEDGQQSSRTSEEQTISPTSTSLASAMVVHVPKDDTASKEVCDKRTTFMIRNIPNKYTQSMLLDCINETHFGKFDFLYLRMDFKNKCNVGYAFINFINTDVVASFIKEHVGKKWSRFNSDKICSLSYATIQGRQALIDKFRNSSVMDEDMSYRPKIFYTSGPNTGQEEPFPEPTANKDNGRGMPRRRTSSTPHGEL
ncbi:hypothetical protein BGZ51_005168 [Haplosporangium sp. Z 767]|nr:hypothetical protein BGZ51_005168 [Haplosporangium sp. Z 767]KAF9183461.1 hypothetical protein BGZ50_004223 [Haplosporangium sp. Z 11]